MNSNRKSSGKKNTDTLSYDGNRSPLSASGIYVQTIEQSNREEKLKQQLKELEKYKAKIQKKEQLKKLVKQEEDEQLLREGIERLQKRFGQ